MRELNLDEIRGVNNLLEKYIEVPRGMSEGRRRCRVVMSERSEMVEQMIGVAIENDV